MYIDRPLYYYSRIYIFQAPQQPILSHLKHRGAHPFMSLGESG